MAEPVERLRRLAERAPELGEDGEWLAERLADYLAAHGTSLEECLGLRAEQSQPSWRTIERRRRRAALIRSLAAEHCPSLSRHQQAHVVADLLRQYQSTAWVRDRHAEQLPAGYSGTRALLFEIFHLAESPTSWRAIWQILDSRFCRKQHGPSANPLC